MNEANVRLTISHVLRERGFWPLHATDAVKCSKCGALFYPAKGRPDILALHPAAASIVVEVKVIKIDREKSFPFSAIDERQRKWLTRWLEAGGSGYLGLGIIGRHGGRDSLEAIYLVDWADWIEVVEDAVTPYQQSLPYAAGKGFAKVLQENNLDIQHLLKPYSLVKDSAGWALPEGHTAIREAH